MADVGRHCDQFCLLFSGGTLGQEKADSRDADDAENRGVRLDDLYGARVDRKMRGRGKMGDIIFERHQKWIELFYTMEVPTGK